jgi:hypothetical protein
MVIGQYGHAVMMTPPVMMKAPPSITLWVGGCPNQPRSELRDHEEEHDVDSQRATEVPRHGVTT